jgi:hypothetical protein
MEAVILLGILLAAIATVAAFFRDDLAILLGGTRKAPRWIEEPEGPGFWASTLWALLLLSWPVGTLIALFGWRPGNRAGGVFCADCGHARDWEPENPHFSHCPHYVEPAPLAELADRLRRLHANGSDEFRRLPAYESARRFLAEYEASGPTAEAAALAEQAARDTREALSIVAADIPDVGHRDFRGERWARGLQLVDSARQGRTRPR